MNQPRFELFRRTAFEQLRPFQLPHRFRNADYDTIPNAAIRDCVKDYLRDFWKAAESGIAPAFFGPTGKYKTYGAFALLRRVRELARIDVDFAECPGALLQLDRSFYANAGSLKLELYKSIPLLLIDDITTLRGNSRALDLLVEIGTRRFSEQLPTIYTANCSVRGGNLDELTDHVGSCLARRIWHGSEGYRVEVSG